jgi:leader peptidase (prepilin peptidase)/N-methyltransferase
MVLEQYALPIGAFWGVLLGLIVGSFVATIAVRWPSARRISAGQSVCDCCAAPLKAANLIPVLSFLMQGGRCAACRARIDRIHPAMELLCAGIGGISAIALAHQPFEALAAALLGWQLALLAALDWRAFWLPDRLTLPLLATGLLFAGLNGSSILYAAIGGAAIGFLSLDLLRQLFIALRQKEGMGQGDPKLFGAIGAWVGWQGLGPVLLAAALVGIAAHVMQQKLPRSDDHVDLVPFGTMLAVAAWPLWLWQQLT